MNLRTSPPAYSAPVNVEDASQMIETVKAHHTLLHKHEAKLGWVHQMFGQMQKFVQYILDRDNQVAAAILDTQQVVRSQGECLAHQSQQLATHAQELEQSENDSVHFQVQMMEVKAEIAHLHADSQSLQSQIGEQFADLGRGIV